MKTVTDEKFLTTEDGRQVPIRSVSLLELQMIEQGIERDYRERGEPIDPPTYQAILAGGEEVSYAHDETTLEVPDNPELNEENKRRWALYRDAVSRMEAERSRLQLEVVMEGLLVEPTPAWEAKMRRRKVRVPEDEVEKRLLYIQLEVLPTPGDLSRAYQEIVYISSSGAVPREVIEAAAATFRGEIQAAAEKLSRDWNAARAVEDRAGALDTVPANGGGGGG